MTTEFACRHESCARSTSTLKIAKQSGVSRRGSLICSECSFRFEVDLGPYGSHLHVDALLLFASELCELQAVPSSSSATDSSSLSQAVIRLAVATLGGADCRVKSQWSKPSGSSTRSTFSSESSGSASPLMSDVLKGREITKGWTDLDGCLLERAAVNKAAGQSTPLKPGFADEDGLGDRS